jgi:hypothetical protein
MYNSIFRIFLSSLRQFYCFSWVTICFKQSFLFQYKRQVIDLHSITPVLCCFPRQKTFICTSAAIYIYSIEPIKTTFFLRYTCSTVYYAVASFSLLWTYCNVLTEYYSLVNSLTSCGALMLWLHTPVNAQQNIDCSYLIFICLQVFIVFYFGSLCNIMLLVYLFCMLGHF